MRGEEEFFMVYDPAKGMPGVPEDMVAFYRQLIDKVCKTPEQHAEATAALERRAPTPVLERIIYPPDRGGRELTVPADG